MSTKFLINYNLIFIPNFNTKAQFCKEFEKLIRAAILRKALKLEIRVTIVVVLGLNTFHIPC